MIGLYFNQPALILIGMFASLYHTFNHAIFKSILFLSAGSVIERTGESDIEHLGGLIKYIPWVATSFLI
jgi:formate hydrogenlyase subunit 3/multisubunit Na+/H+ antiporter MnhD subunit